MHDLRRQALESSKTVSRKARSRQTSRTVSNAGSQPTSHPGSRTHSRAPSDDEDGFSDDTNYSINSIDEFLASDDINEGVTENARAKLDETMEAIFARKGSSAKSREDCLIAWNSIMSTHLHGDSLFGKVQKLVDSFSKSIKSGGEKEVVLALKSLALLVVSYKDNIYEHVSDLLRRMIEDSKSSRIKTAAIYTFGDCLSYAGASDDEKLDQMTFLLEVVSSDGNFVDAADDANVVTAASQVWGFLASQIQDLEAESEDAIEAFMEQLDSSKAEVQIAAGDNIALLYEKAAKFPSENWRDHSDDEEEDDDEDNGNDDDDAEDDDEAEDDEEEDESEPENGHGSGTSSPKVPRKRYEPYHNSHVVLTKCLQLSTLSTPKISQRTKRSLHQSFRAISLTVENPARGFIWNNNSRSRGSMVLRIHDNGDMYIDRWWKLIRLNSIRRLLSGGGFINHYYEGNKQILEMLPVIITRRNMRDGANGGTDYSAGGAQGFSAGVFTPEKGEKGNARQYKDSSYSPRSLKLMAGGGDDYE